MEKASQGDNPKQRKGRGISGMTVKDLLLSLSHLDSASTCVFSLWWSGAFTTGSRYPEEHLPLSESGRCMSIKTSIILSKSNFLADFISFSVVIYFIFFLNNLLLDFSVSLTFCV